MNHIPYCLHIPIPVWLNHLKPSWLDFIRQDHGSICPLYCSQPRFLSVASGWWLQEIPEKYVADFLGDCGAR